MGFTSNIRDSFAVELWGLREGPWLIRGKGYRNLVVELDSEAVVTTMKKDLDLWLLCLLWLRIVFA